MQLRTWRSLPEFLERCDFMALPPEGMVGAAGTSRTAQQHADGTTRDGSPDIWPALQPLPPASIAELLGFGDATGSAGSQELLEAAAAGEPVPAAVRRNESRVLAALHELTDLTQAGQAVAGRDLHCWACTQPNGTEALRACRSRGRAGKEQRIGERRARVGWPVPSPPPASHPTLAVSPFRHVRCAAAHPPPAACCLVAPASLCVCSLLARVRLAACAGIVVTSTSDKEDLVMSEANKRAYAARRAGLAWLAGWLAARRAGQLAASSSSSLPPAGTRRCLLVRWLVAPSTAPQSPTRSHAPTCRRWQARL